jgi:hypothetical protein
MDSLGNAKITEALAPNLSGDGLQKRRVNVEKVKRRINSWK